MSVGKVRLEKPERKNNNGVEIAPIKRLCVLYSTIKWIKEIIIAITSWNYEK